MSLLANDCTAAPLPEHGRHVAAIGFLEASCLDCHGNGSRKGKLDLDPVVEALRAGTLTADQRAILRRARVRVASGEMPPHG